MLQRICILLLSWMSAHASVTALYLTWHEDPTTTMEIYWHTPEYDANDTIYLQSKDLRWHAIVGSHTELHYLFVHAVHLAQLQPDTEYSFRIGEDPTIYKFKTAPSTLKSPIQFIIGGDADYNGKTFSKMNKVIAEKNPLFCVIGGDIAYAIRGAPIHRMSSPFNRWLSFLIAWKKEMVTKDGFLIPFLLVAGNHDISKEDPSLFFSLFPSPTKELYRSLYFGNYLGLILLDTGHLSPIEGAQTSWLNKTLGENSQIPFRFAVYHEAAYPSHYPYEGNTPKRIRSFWCPLFDKYKLSAAFENHNHAFKRTHPLTNNEIDPQGMIYFGDGCWGAPPRKTNNMWYLAKEEQRNNVYLVQMNETTAEIHALDLEGKIFDSTTLNRSLPSSNHPSIEAKPTSTEELPVHSKTENEGSLNTKLQESEFLLQEMPEHQ